MEPSLDIRKIANALLEKAKAYFHERGSLPPKGFIVEPSGKLAVVDLDFSSREATKGSQRTLAEEARAMKAVAVFTIRDATYRVFPPDESDPRQAFDDPEQAKFFVPDGKPRTCVSMGIKIPGETEFNVLVPYRRDPFSGIIFGAHEEGPVEFKGPEPPSEEDEEWSVD